MLYTSEMIYPSEKARSWRSVIFVLLLFAGHHHIAREAMVVLPRHGIKTPFVCRSKFLTLNTRRSFASSQVGGDGPSGARWRLSERHLLSIAGHHITPLLENLRLLVVAFDNMREEDRNNISTIDEIVNNRDWYVRRGNQITRKGIP